MRRFLLIHLVYFFAICKIFSQNAEIQGKLYIIGGGERPVSMMMDIINISGIDVEKDYGIILPMSSEEPDSAFFYGKRSFQRCGVGIKC